MFELFRKWAPIVIAASLVAILSVLIWDNYLRHSRAYKDYDQHTKDERRQAASEIYQSCIAYREPNTINCFLKHLEARDKKNDTNKDLQAQQQMAYWTGLMAFFTVILTAITGLGVFFVWWTFSKNTIQVLPVVVVRKGTILRIERGISVSFELENLGKTSAKNIIGSGSINNYNIPGRPGFDDQEFAPLMFKFQELHTGQVEKVGISVSDGYFQKPVFSWDMFSGQFTYEDFLGRTITKDFAFTGDIFPEAIDEPEPT